MFALLISLSLLQETQLRAFSIPTSGAGVSIDVSGEWFAQFVPSAANPPLRLFRRVTTGWTRTLGIDVLSGLSASDLTVAQVEVQPPYLMYATPRLNQDRGGMVIVEFDDAGQLLNEIQFPYSTEHAQFGGALTSLADGTIASGMRGLRHISNRPFTGNVGGISIGRINSGSYVESQLIVPSDERLFSSALSFSNYQLGNYVELDGDWLISSARAGTFGAVHTYLRDSRGDYVETQVIDPPSPAFLARFGAGIAIEGNLMVIGEPESGSQYGEAYVYRYSETTLHWERGETLRPENPDTGLMAGDRFGAAVAIDEGHIYVGATNESIYGGIYQFRPDLNGVFGPYESHVFASSIMGGDLGETIKVEDGFLIATDRGSARSIQAFSAAVEVDICSSSVANGIKLDAWLDSTAEKAPNGLRRRGLILSGVPQGTRFILLGGLTPDATASGSLFGATGLCLSPPLARIGFGVSSSWQELALLDSDDLHPAGDRLLAVVGTVYVQGFCVPPSASGIPASWSNGFELDVRNW